MINSIIFFIEVSKWKIRTYEKTSCDRHSYSDTEEHLVNAMVAVNKGMNKKLNAATF